MLNFPYLHSFCLPFVGHYSRDTLDLSSRAKHSFYPKVWGFYTLLYPELNLALTEKCSHRENQETQYISAREAFFIYVEEILNRRCLNPNC